MPNSKRCALASVCHTTRGDRLALDATAAERAARERDSKGDVEQAMRWLQNASDHGIGPASHNLASAYLAGGGDLPPAERRAKVKAARDQGFAFFAGEPGDERRPCRGGSAPSERKAVECLTGLHSKPHRRLQKRRSLWRGFSTVTSRSCSW